MHPSAPGPVVNAMINGTEVVPDANWKKEHYKEKRPKSGFVYYWLFLKRKKGNTYEGEWKPIHEGKAPDSC